MEERLVRIETKISFAEDLLDELNSTVYRQQQQIERLQKQVLQLHEQLQTVRHSGGDRDLRDEIPPHY